jgi:hypothetical protein
MRGSLAGITAAAEMARGAIRRRRKHRSRGDGPPVAPGARPPRAKRARAEAEHRSLAWLLSGDRTAAFARSFLVAAVAAVAWAIALHLGETPLLGPETLSPVLAERLLLDRDDAGPRRLALFTRKLPTQWTVPEETRQAIRDAADRVGVDAGFLTAVAALESSFDAQARAPRTTARGLYQFTEDTWLRVVKVFGAKHGLAVFAAAIALGEDGAVVLPQWDVRQTLMQLRSDPATAALMAAELALDNKMRLERLLARPVSPAEIYLAHFLGLASAARMIEAASAHPHVSAARLLPAAAATNPGVFGPPDEPVSAGAIVARIEAYVREDVPRLAGI